MAENENENENENEKTPEAPAPMQPSDPIEVVVWWTTSPGNYHTEVVGAKVRNRVGRNAFLATIMNGEAEGRTRCFYDADENIFWRRPVK